MTVDAGEDVEKEEHSSNVGGIASLYNHSENHFGGSSEKWTYDADGVYWAFYVNGEYAVSGVDSTPIAEGESYSFKVEKG